MLNAIDKKLLKAVADLEDIPKGAFNIRKTENFFHVKCRLILRLSLIKIVMGLSYGSRREL